MKNDKLVRHGVFAEWLKNRADDLASRAQIPTPGGLGYYIDDELSSAAAVLYDAYRTYQLQPAVDAAEVVHSDWGNDPTAAVCGRCGTAFPFFLRLYPWCPNCGAKMDGQSGEEAEGGT